jgi:hypothetical protein
MHETMSPTIGSLVAAIANVMGAFRGVDKTGVNQFHRYKYASDADLLWTLKPIMAQHGLAFVLVDYTASPPVEVKTAKGGVERLVDLSATYRIAHTSGEWMTVTAPGSGQDPGDKAHYKAMTGAMKYALRQTFAVPTGDDPEGDAEPQRQAPAREQPSTVTGRAPDAKPAEDLAPKRRPNAAKAMRDLKLFDEAVAFFGPVDQWTMAQMDAMKDTPTWTAQLAARGS